MHEKKTFFIFDCIVHLRVSQGKYEIKRIRGYEYDMNSMIQILNRNFTHNFNMKICNRKEHLKRSSLKMQLVYGVHITGIIMF